MSQHESLSPERWGSFPVERQILMIGNEMNRARHLRSGEDGPSIRRAYERVLRLTDLTVEVAASRGLRRELLRWRDLIAVLYLESKPTAERHDAALRALLALTPGSARQIPLLFP